MTQCEMIIKHLNEHGSITQMDAVKFGCYRLSARIHDLRELGYEIETKTETKGKSTYARYSIGKEINV